jgi:hypothetical protein
MEWIVRTKLAIWGIVQSVFENPRDLMIAASLLFFGSIALFAGLYYFLHRYHLVSAEIYKNQVMLGGSNPLPAFQMSDVMRKRFEVKAKNDLRLWDIGGQLTNVKWQSFSRDRLGQRQFPADAKQWDDFHDRGVTGLTPTDMIEKTFKQYGLVSISVSAYRDNSFDQIFPIKVMSEYFEVPSIVVLQNRLAAGNLSLPEQKLWAVLQTVAPEIRVAVLQQTNLRPLWTVAEQMKSFADRISEGAEKKERIRDIVYGETLSVLAPPGTQLEFNFQTMPMHPEFFDFIWLSSTVGTSNIPSELTPLTNDARTLIWLQLMGSYFLLALIVAAFAKFIKLA